MCVFSFPTTYRGRARKAHGIAFIAVIDEASYGDYQDNWDIDGWASICAPGSPLKLAKGFESRQEDWTPPRPSFIYDHVAAMDTCNHPDEQPLHGFTAW